MKDLLLKFPDYATALSTLGQLNMTYIDEENNTKIITSSHDYVIDNIGTEFNAISDDTSYCMNIRLLSEINVTTLEPYLIQPRHQLRVWA